MMLHNKTMRAAAISTTIISLLSTQSCDAFLSSSSRQRTSALISSSSVNNLPATSVGDKSRKLQSCRASSTPLFMSAPTQLPDTIHELAAEAQTTPQMMRVLWQLAADACKNMQKGVSYHQHYLLVCSFFAQLNSSICCNSHCYTTEIISFSTTINLFNRSGLSHHPLARHGTKTLQPNIPQQTNGPL